MYVHFESFINFTVHHSFSVTYFPLTLVFFYSPVIKSSRRLSSCSSEVKNLFIMKTKREVQRILVHECRCHVRLKGKDEGSTRLTYKGLCGGLAHQKIKTRLRDENFESEG